MPPLLSLSLSDGDTVWLSQQQMADLFGKARTTIVGHVKNVFKEGELDEEVVYLDFRHTTSHGAIEGKTQTKKLRHYNLDVIISVGYRVKSLRGTQFRIWATQRLREYLNRGLFRDPHIFPTELHRRPRVKKIS